ncbi:MAG: alpha/beta hydrolase [Pseudomonadota bacterium]
MSLRLRLLNLGLRLLVKPALRRLRDPLVFRARLERTAGRIFTPPRGAHFVVDSVRRPETTGTQGHIDTVWASVGRPDRRRLILYLHGGAYLAGSGNTHRHLAAALGKAAGARAMVPDYRLAPEHPFPAALEDAALCYRALLETGYDPMDIAVAGDSAGGGLAFCLLQKLAAENVPPPACAVAFSPWADLTGESDTLVRNAARDVMLPASRMSEVTDFIMAGHDRADPFASPVLGRWRDPPPAMIMASRHEILLGDAVNLAEALRMGGGDVQLELWRHTPHAWPIFVGRLAEADAAVAHAGSFISRHLGIIPMETAAE